MSMVDDIRLAFDCDGTVESYKLILETSFGTHEFDVDPRMLEEALRDYRAHVEQGELVAAERAAAGGGSWAEYVESLNRVDPEYVDAMLESGDFLRKADRENGPLVNIDPADDSTYLDAA